MLAGAKPLTEGWSYFARIGNGCDEWREKRRYEIIQLDGRGDRIKGLRFKQKRT